MSHWWGGYDADAKRVVKELLAARQAVLPIEVNGEPVAVIQYEKNAPDYRTPAVPFSRASQGRARARRAFASETSAASAQSPRTRARG